MENIRIKIEISIPTENTSSIEDFSFFIYLPCRLNNGDHLDLEELVNEADVTQEQFKYLWDNAFIVDFVVFGKDINGVFQRVFAKVDG